MCVQFTGNHLLTLKNQPDCVKVSIASIKHHHFHLLWAIKIGIYQQAMVFIYLFVWFWFLCFHVRNIGLGPSLVLTPQLFFPSRCLDLKRLFLPPRPSVVCQYLCFYVHINIPNAVNTVEKEPTMLRSAPLQKVARILFCESFWSCTSGLRAKHWGAHMILFSSLAF